MILGDRGDLGDRVKETPMLFFIYCFSYMLQQLYFFISVPIVSKCVSLISLISPVTPTYIAALLRLMMGHVAA